jgi:polyhydroxybutyrate depolymerase
MKNAALLILTFFTLSASAQQQKWEQILVDGIRRDFVTYIPSVTDASYKMPVIVCLHGRLGTGENMMSFADFRSLAQKEKFIIVCPDGIDKSWNAGRPTPANRKGINDVKFIDQLITYILDTYLADAARVYVTGMSNGGFMSSRLACELSNRIAAVAVVAASMDANMAYRPVKPMPIMYIQGTKDPLAPFDGGTTKSAKGMIYSHNEAIKLWVTTDHCDSTPVINNLPDKQNDGTFITKEAYTNPATGIKVIGYTVNNGGHTWPGGTQYLPKFLIGTLSHNMNACEVIWDFFNGYRLVD